MILSSNKNSGTGGGIAGTPNYEAPISGSIDGSNASFTFAHAVKEVIVNSGLQIPGGVDVTISGTNAIFTTPPELGSTVYNKYLT